ncbi:hypothetical protein M404DRAFT_1004393 [Pisolithus tinctorius Marx 270]|uniref:Uncharacterized protein n=1 Tax=Pisolithus tinctorius Marx 270 TaxID=870435 RepID=A0A0C3JQ98_PISTI|nr:hypothetical protein M404DRAFT_1004393 [Pisolithus tinctorius Marx 270]
MAVEVGEAPTTLPTSEDVARAEVDTAGSDELLADAEGSTASVVPGSNNGAHRASEGENRFRNWEGSALPQLLRPRRPPSSPRLQHKRSVQTASPRPQCE